MNRNQASRPVSQQTRKIPAGLVSIWPSSTIPKGWLLCDGTGYDIATYPALYAAIGNTYGSASPTFLVPDMRTFVPYYTGVLNATAGVSTVTLTAAQSGLVSHAHTYVDFWPNTEYTNVTDDAAGVSGIRTEGTAIGETSSHLIISGTTYASGIGASTAHTNLQPYLLINFIIKT
jgi:microcystin-dependent protein